MKRRDFVARASAGLAALHPFARPLFSQSSSGSPWLLVPMDDVQADHLKAYGLTYRALKRGARAEWFLNYRSGAFLLSGDAATTRDAALAGFHGGGLVTEDPQSPHTLAPALGAELYFGHADNDGSNSAEQIAALDAALDEAGVTHTTELYEGAAHGYTMADTPVYDEQAAERHFEALFDLLDRTTRQARG